MEQIANVRFGMLFEHVVMLQNAFLGVSESVIHHTSCGFTYKTTLVEKYNSHYGYYANPVGLYCPNCGKRINFDDSLWYTNPSHDIPYDIDITCVEHKNALDIVIRANIVRTSDNLIFRVSKQVKEGIRFDFKNRTTYALRWNGTKLLKEDLCVSEHAPCQWKLPNLFNYLNSESRAAKMPSVRKQFKDFMKTVRERFHERLQETVGHPIKGCYYPESWGSYDNALLKPVQSMMWRMICTDSKGIHDKDMHALRINPLHPDVYKQMRKGTALVQALTRTYGPSSCDTPYVRRLVGSHLDLVFSLRSVDGFKNRDYRYRLLKLMTDKSDVKRLLANHSEFICEVIKRKGEAFAFKVIELATDDSYFLADTRHIVSKLEDEFAELYWAGVKRARDFHDYATYVFDKQNTEWVSFVEVPDELNADMNGFQFKVVTEGTELVDISNALHNCVKTYQEKVIEGECAIVAVKQDDNYTACIELQKGSKGTFDRIAQARLDQNVRISNDEQCLMATLAWAKKHKIMTKSCSDFS